MTNEPSELERRARQALRELPLDRLTDPIFRREPGRYYTLINYPPLRAMDEHNQSRFPFIAPTKNPKRLYIHVPFCSGHCTFCNYRIIVGEADRWPYLRALLRELELLAEQYGGELEISTVLFGGGTPSLLTLEELQFLFDGVLERVKLTGPYFNFELHPEMVRAPDAEHKLRYLRDRGVNRVNVGLQTFDDTVLTHVNRRHTADDALKLVDLTKRAEFVFTNFDLIYGLPGQTIASWKDTIRRTIDLEPTSISPFYCWMKPTSPIFQQFKRSPNLFASREEWLVMCLMYMDAFQAAGYRFGQIDFFFKPPPEIDAQHPIKADDPPFVHTDLDVLPIGISGYGLINGTRYMNHVDLDEYYGAIERGVLPIYRYYQLPPDDVLRLNLMYALRYDYMRDFVRTYGPDEVTRFHQTWEDLEAKGLITRDGQHGVEIRLTTAGKIFGDEACMSFVSESIRERMRRPLSERHAKLIEMYSYLYDLSEK